jgi:hypothetical protein
VVYFGRTGKAYLRQMVTNIATEDQHESCQVGRQESIQFGIIRANGKQRWMEVHLVFSSWMRMVCSLFLNPHINTSSWYILKNYWHSSTWLELSERNASFGLIWYFAVCWWEPSLLLHYSFIFTFINTFHSLTLWVSSY